MQQQQRYYQPSNPRRGPGASLWMRFLPWLMILAVIVVLVLFGLRAMRDNRVEREIAPYESVFADNVYVDGINLSGMSAQSAYDAVLSRQQQSVSGWNLALVYNGHTYVTVDYQTLGLNVNQDSINQTLKQAWDMSHTGDAYQRKAAIDRLKSEPYYASTVHASEFSSAKLDGYLQSIASYIDGMSKPEDARLIRFDPNQPDPFIIQKEQVGYKLDVQAARDQIMALASEGSSGEYQLKPQIIQPAVTEAMLRENMQLRSTAQTEISTRSEYNRVQNIILSSSKISGTILKPGEIFSFNKTAEDRSEKNGYLPAEEQAYGNYVTGIGGGVCQTSTTIFQAALLGNLEITKRREHGEPVLYTDPGLDATVYMTKGYEIDFKFKNNTAHDLYVSVRVKPGASSRKQVVEVKLYGEPLEPGVKYQLKTIKTEVLFPPAEPEYIKDTKGYYTTFKGEEVKKASAKEGSVVDTYLQKFVNGALVEEKLVAKSSYPARQEQIWVGVKDQI